MEGCYTIQCNVKLSVNNFIIAVFPVIDKKFSRGLIL